MVKASANNSTEDTTTATDAAENTNTKLEINSSHEFLNVEQLRKIKDYNVKFIIGSDAHIPQNVGNFDLALETVNKSSLDKSLIENILV